MKGRSGIVTFFIFLFLSAIVLLEILSMVQSDRLYERLNRLAKTFANTAPRWTVQTQPSDSIGDEGDWLVWALGAEPTTLNPITRTDMAASWVNANIFESLLEYDPDKLTLRPLLAQRYEVSEDGLEITFRLRDDVYFSDGQAITADDVIFTFQTIKNPKVDAASLANYYKDVEKAVKINDREVKFVLSRLYFKSLEFVGGMGIIPKHVYAFSDPEEFNKHRSKPIGSGPYVFEKWDVGRQIVLRRNDRYWGSKKPKLARIVYRIITNNTAALQALRAGQVDFLRPLPEQFFELSKDKKFTSEFRCLSYWNPGVGYFYIGWNQARPFFKDRRVRLAMTHLVDRQAICTYLLKGTAQVPTGPFYIHSRQHDPTIKPWPFDPDRARELLDEAGWIDTDGDGIRDKDGVPLRFTYMIVSGTSLHTQLAKLVKDAAAKAGIEVTPDPYEWSVFVERLNTRSFDAVNLAWGGSVESDPYQIWHSSQCQGRGSNYVGFKNDQADKLIEQARQTLDEEKRNKLYHRFHQLIHHEQPYTFVYTRPSQRFLHKRFKNVKIHKLGLDPHEWYVPKAQQRYK